MAAYSDTYYVDKNYAGETGGFYLRFTDDPFIDIEHKYSRWYMDDMELEYAIDSGLKEGKDYFKDEDAGMYFKLHTGLSGHRLDAETLENAIKEVEAQNNWYKRSDKEDWSIFESDDNVRVQQDTPEGSTFYPKKVLFTRSFAVQLNSLPTTIIINGTPRSTTNSKGQPIAKTEQGIRNFYKWFGDSKVVDDKGRPLVVYHGTNKEFDEFEGDVIYFAIDENEADGYAQYRSDGGVPSVKSAYLKIEKPAYEDEFINILNNLGVNEDHDILNASSLESESVRNEFIKNGYDGLVNVPDFGFLSDFNEIPVCVVFSPSQIKSATGNDGSFDADDNSILSGLPGSQQQFIEKLKTMYAAGNTPTPGRINKLAEFYGITDQKVIDELVKEAMKKENTLIKIDMSNYKNQFEVNQAIEKLINDKGEFGIYSSEEKIFIRNYTGSGGLANQGATGKGILYEFYTPEYICDLMFDLAYAYGFDDGNILEPSCGTGELIRPAKDYNKVSAFEINKVSATITKVLYPGINVFNDYFETAFMQSPRFTSLLKYPNVTWLKGYPFSLVIGNPPYGRYQSMYSRYFNKKLFAQVEIFFIIQGLQLLKPGGLLIYLQSSNFLRNGDKYNEAKEYINHLAEFIDAYRLPSVFKYSEVPTDIMVLRKKQTK